jgi:hypothetical protein
MRWAVGNEGDLLAMQLSTYEERCWPLPFAYWRLELEIVSTEAARLEQRRDSAKLYASQVRSRKPEMQVKRLEK